MIELEATQRPDEGLGRKGGAQRPALMLMRIWPADPYLELPLLSSVVRLGRDPSLEVVSGSRLASRLHAEIVRDGPIHLIRDLGSTNGVYLNGERVEQGPLTAGTVVRFGDQVLIVQHGGAGPIRELAPGVLGGALLAQRFEQLRLVAKTDLPIVIEGATGTGKEGAAAATHLWSERKGRLVALNCAAIPMQLAEAELFGHARGAFTGATQARPGCFRDADGGTLFLDEVLELPAELSSKLLRALEQGEVIPVGESRPIPVDVRVIVASQGSLKTATDEQRFRSDVFARLEGFTLSLPKLEDRRGDIPALFESFVRAASVGAEPPDIDVVLMEHLVLAGWPRNIRQLRAGARRLVALQPEAPRLTLEMWTDTDDTGSLDPPGSSPSGAAPPNDELLVQLLASLERAGGNLTQAAKDVGISRPRAYRLLQNADIDLDAVRSSTPASDETTS